jgi:hypothetical protein
LCVKNENKEEVRMAERAGYGRNMYLSSKKVTDFKYKKRRDLKSRPPDMALFIFAFRKAPYSPSDLQQSYMEKYARFRDFYDRKVIA